MTARERPETIWRKSSYSNGTEDGACVEVALAPGAVRVRDSKNPRAGHLVLDRATWRAFLQPRV